MQQHYLSVVWRLELLYEQSLVDSFDDRIGNVRDHLRSLAERVSGLETVRKCARTAGICEYLLVIVLVLVSMTR